MFLLQPLGPKQFQSNQAALVFATLNYETAIRNLIHREFSRNLLDQPSLEKRPFDETSICVPKKCFREFLHHRLVMRMFVDLSLIQVGLLDVFKKSIFDHPMRPFACQSLKRRMRTGTCCRPNSSSAIERRVPSRTCNTLVP